MMFNVKKHYLDCVFTRVQLLVSCAILTATAIHVCGGLYCMYNTNITTLSLQPVDTCIHTQSISVVRYRYSSVGLLKLRCIYVLRLRIKGYCCTHTDMPTYNSACSVPTVYTFVCSYKDILCQGTLTKCVCVCVAVCTCMTSFRLGSPLWW